MEILNGKTERYWMEALACTVGHYLYGRVDWNLMYCHYRDFLNSPVATEELRAALPALPEKKAAR